MAEYTITLSEAEEASIRAYLEDARRLGTMPPLAAMAEVPMSLQAWVEAAIHAQLVAVYAWASQQPGLSMPLPTPAQVPNA